MSSTPELRQYELYLQSASLADCLEISHHIDAEKFPEKYQLVLQAIAQKGELGPQPVPPTSAERFFAERRTLLWLMPVLGAGLGGAFAAGFGLWDLIEKIPEKFAVPSYQRFVAAVPTDMYAWSQTSADPDVPPQPTAFEFRLAALGSVAAIDSRRSSPAAIDSRRSSPAAIDSRRSSPAAADSLGGQTARTFKIYATEYRFTEVVEALQTHRYDSVVVYNWQPGPNPNQIYGLSLIAGNQTEVILDPSQRLNRQLLLDLGRILLGTIAFMVVGTWVRRIQKRPRPGEAQTPA